MVQWDLKVNQCQVRWCDLVVGSAPLVFYWQLRWSLVVCQFISLFDKYITFWLLHTMYLLLCSFFCNIFVVLSSSLVIIVIICVPMDCCPLSSAAETILKLYLSLPFYEHGWLLIWHNMQNSPSTEGSIRTCKLSDHGHFNLS